MAKDPQAEIQKKLVELELSIEADEAKQPPAVAEKGGQLAVVAGGTKAARDEETLKSAVELHTYGGVALALLGIWILFSHVQVTMAMGMLGPYPAIGYLVLPLMVGLGMLFYNYKSRLAQAVAGGSLLLLLITVITSLRMTMFAVTAMDLILMVAPISAGIALIAKGQIEQRALEGKQK